jgi:exopolyphosphatase/guanosine-5'-triphosphate,3'-diphosphate pyrophosphatase
LLSHADAAGFSQSQQRRLAEMVLAQRGGLRKVESALGNDTTAWQILCLRLAVIKCHARQEADTRALSLSRQDHQARLMFSREWAQAKPRTLYLLQEEAGAWERSNSALQLLLPS